MATAARSIDHASAPVRVEEEERQSLRPRGVSPYAWTRMTPKERAASAMHAKTEEWDWRGSLSDMKPLGIQPEDLAIVARVLLAIGEHEFATLSRIGLQAAAET